MEDAPYVVTNDDGIDAPGIRALREAIGENTVTVAPMGPMSQKSHQITTAEPIRVDQRSGVEFAVDGSPADCTRIALAKLCPEAKGVVSGINAGGNLGHDVYISGTVAAAREAAFLGKPAVAVSHYKKMGLDFDWVRAGRWTAAILEDLFARPHEAGTFWNVNLPNLESGAPEPSIVECAVCTEPLPVSFDIEGETYRYRGVYSKRSRTPGSDVERCFNGEITISMVRL